MEKETLELLLPQWQGGNNPDYQIGNEILAAIVPHGQNIERLKVPVATTPLPDQNQGIDGETALLTQFQITTDILKLQQPRRVITLGGDCSISEAPFDYLNGHYDRLGIIWLDVHPDVSNLSNSHHLHEMVLANLLNAGAPVFNEQVKNHVDPSHVMLAGLKYDELRPMDQTVNELSLNYATPDDLAKDNQIISNWIATNNIQHVAVHWDLDVLNPDDFRSIYPGQPHTNPDNFPAAVGNMTLKQVFSLLNMIGLQNDLVGLSIAEHMPWDAINLRNGLSDLAIFK
ncbi:arginase family protein [Lactiplantibacillus sp. WILCCON 0030]|uniref:Arginase family protein n=1 Tax=Lactiplantibacillus brownii TaxID=3069269 RepID=A0ABU1ABN7_9LACO|nr:arginase family protein [Lactiplantibacillus brownii]MDQ7938384.1 arginase family protein [Lactiplantibacillus brownii]